jgi:hypothetical protein
MIGAVRMSSGRVAFGRFAALMVCIFVASANASAQMPPSDLDSAVLSAVRAALEPALPYPASDEIGELPVDGTTTAPWMIRPTQDGDLTIEVLANPLNATNQTRAAKAMMQIQTAIEAAQRRSQAAYEKAIADAQRTGRSQDFDGITLGDEGVAGARIDAEAHVTIDIAFNRPTYLYSVNSSVEPSPLPVSGAIAAVNVPANVYRDGRDAATNERFCAAETHVFFGAVAVPEVHKRSNIGFEMSAASAAPAAANAGVRSVVVSLRGNPQLIDQIIKRADWTRVQTLVAPK